jgi:hypothetical protein
MARKIDPLRLAIVESLEGGAMTRAALRELVAHTISPGEAYRKGQASLEWAWRRRKPKKPRTHSREQLMSVGRNHLFAWMLKDLERCGHVGIERRLPRADDVITLVRVPPAIAFERRTKASA